MNLRNRKKKLNGLIGIALGAFALFAFALQPVCASAVEEAAAPAAPKSEYTVGIDDILDINVLKPEELKTTVTVSPDGFISFPYIGSAYVKGMTLPGVQEEIQNRLSDGYMKYPVVAVALQMSRSKKFFVYGEVMKPGAYPLDENMSVFKALSVAGGFTKFGASSRVKVLRPKANSASYEAIKVDIKAIMDGQTDKDIPVQTGDVIVVTEGIL